ncbi:MAG: hypothetical protein ACXWCO_00800 [Caldimonas sp.]
MTDITQDEVDRIWQEGLTSPVPDYVEMALDYDSRIRLRDLEDVIADDDLLGYEEPNCDGLSQFMAQRKQAKVRV